MRLLEPFKFDSIEKKKILRLVVKVRSRIDAVLLSSRIATNAAYNGDRKVSCIFISKRCDATLYRFRGRRLGIHSPSVDYIHGLNSRMIRRLISTRLRPNANWLKKLERRSNLKALAAELMNPHDSCRCSGDFWPCTQKQLLQSTCEQGGRGEQWLTH